MKTYGIADPIDESIYRDIELTCICPMDDVDPAFNADLEDFCVRCGQVIDFDKFEAYKASHGLSGYDEDSRDIEQTQSEGNYDEE